MKNVVAWMKANPLSVASFAVILVSLLAIGYFVVIANPALRETAANQPKKDISQIRGFSSQTIEVPPANADDPPERVTGVTINAATIEVLDRIYTDLNSEADAIQAAALALNQPGHLVLVPGLFPDTPSPLRFPAKRAYGDVLGAMLSNSERAEAVAKDTGLFVPYLTAGMPLDSGYVESELAQNRSEALQGLDVNTLTEQRRQELARQQRQELLNLMLGHAETINVYAEPNVGNILQPNTDFPLQVSSLGTTPASPTPAQLWEGQLELWILQDLVRAMGLANRVGDTYEYVDANGQAKSRPWSVLEAPIKRLLRVEVIPGYVGLHTVGGVNTLVSTTAGGSRSGTTATMSPTGYPPPAGGMTNQPRETKLADNFVFGPTGRASNSIYDVRHARVLLHADFQRLPEIFNAISRVNLMTVIDARIADVDEYDLLTDRYVYGQGDIVEVELIVETLWLRSWTAELMPESVQVYVGLKAPEGDQAMPDPSGGGGWSGEFNPQF